jgi:hypothetical protein
MDYNRLSLGQGLARKVLVCPVKHR